MDYFKDGMILISLLDSVCFSLEFDLSSPLTLEEESSQTGVVGEMKLTHIAQ